MKKTIFEKYSIRTPDNFEPSHITEKPLTLSDLRTTYTPEKDPKAYGARLVEGYARFRIEGKIEYTRPLGYPDIVVKKGVTCEVKTGHGWLIEPSFRSIDDLAIYLEERSNPLFNASHIAYLPHRAMRGEDCNDLLFFTAHRLLTILGKYGKLELKENRGLWGVAMKPWITEGYAQNSSKKVEAKILAELEASGLIIEEFAEKMNITLHDLSEGE